MGNGSGTIWENDVEENNQNIKFNEAVELVKTYWQHEDIVTIDENIKRGGLKEDSSDEDEEPE